METTVTNNQVPTEQAVHLLNVVITTPNCTYSTSMTEDEADALIILAINKSKLLQFAKEIHEQKRTDKPSLDLNHYDRPLHSRGALP